MDVRERTGTPFDAAVVAEYTAAGFWDDEPLGERVRSRAAARPDAPAFSGDDGTLSWREYDRQATRLAGRLLEGGLRPGDFLGVLLSDTPAVHAVYIAAERAGLVVVGIGPRARANEIHHMFEVTKCRTLVTEETHRGEPAEVLARHLRRLGSEVTHHFVLAAGPDGGLELSGGGERAGQPPAASPLGPNDLWLINSTSGTTGLPKCVMQTQNRWKRFHQLAVEAGGLTVADGFLGLVPAPYGFGIWTAHVTPTLLGAHTVVMREFDAERALAAIERHRLSVVTCVSTQFVMMLSSPRFDDYDLTSLRVMFTGGERVPRSRAARWEDATGSLVLQFYGSNEAGAVSRTTIHDSRERRLTTAGRIIDDMQVHLVDPEDGTASLPPGRGVCAVRGPTATPGYYADEEANRKLFTPDGLLLCGDVVEIDEQGYLTVVGRESDFVIRGGQNISAHAVEEVVERHPRVRVAGVVGMPDETYGERVCAFVETTDAAGLKLDELTDFLEGGGVSKYMWPERLVVLETVPLGANGKVDKAGLRERVASLVAGEDER